MARYDLHAVKGRPGLLLDVQADALDWLDTRVVIPLTPATTSPLPAKQLNPSFMIDGVLHVMQPQWIVAVPRTRLGRPVGTLTHHWDEIARALDMLLTGF